MSVISTVICIKLFKVVYSTFGLCTWSTVTTSCCDVMALKYLDASLKNKRTITWSSNLAIKTYHEFFYNHWREKSQPQKYTEYESRGGKYFMVCTSLNLQYFGCGTSSLLESRQPEDYSVIELLSYWESRQPHQTAIAAGALESCIPFYKLKTVTARWCSFMSILL